MPNRSQNWFSGVTINTFANRSWNGAQGFARDVYDGRPVIGIANSWSEYVNCNANLRLVAESVKRGVWEAGGLPLEFPTISLGENLMKPCAMMYRNLMSMDVEESIRAYPMDGVVLLAGCDKTTPAQLLAAASADVPAIMVTSGPMLTGRWRDEEIGSGTDLFRFWNDVRTGRMSEEEFVEAESCMNRSVGHCMVMGTASTMTSMAEALGMTLTGCASIPAPDARRYAIAQATGRRIVEMVKEGLRPSLVMTRKSLENAITTLMALGGSTNAVIHLTAIAGRLNIPLPLELMDEISRRTPYLANVKPSGKHMMERFYYAGGLPALMNEIRDLLHTDALTVTGKTMGDNLSGAKIHNDDVIRKRDNALLPEGGIAILRGNLAPGGAVIKQSAASPQLMQHTGRAMVFENREDLLHRIDDPDLDVDANSVLVLKNGGPRGAPGMPEWGQLPLPKKILDAGINDMVRMSDARMSGTSYGTVVLHMSPEAALGGALAVVQTGDMIELDVPNRKLHLHVAPAELDARLRSWKPPAPQFERGYGRLFLDHILQADEGCDFDFLRGVGRDTSVPANDLGAKYALMGHS